MARVGSGSGVAGHKALLAGGLIQTEAWREWDRPIGWGHKALLAGGLIQTIPPDRISYTWRMSQSPFSGRSDSDGFRRGG